MAYVVLGRLDLLIELTNEDINCIAQLDKTCVSHQVVPDA